MLNAFEFAPPRVIYGEGEVKKIGAEAAKFGKKALVVTYDEAFVKQVGFYDKVAASCAEAGVELVWHFGVKSNPTAEHAYPAIELCKKDNIDVIIALGGGSAMDEAKFIGAGALYEGDAWDFYLGKAELKGMKPVIAVVTIPATSSELNGTSVMNNEGLRRKDGMANPILKPSLAILDPELTYTIPLRQTVYSAVDIISHLLEGYLGHKPGFYPYQDHFAEGGIRAMMACMEKLLENPTDPDARGQMMWQASYAWCGFYTSGIWFNQNIHILGHSLSNFYDTPHGAAMGVTILATMRYFLKERTDRYAQFAREVFGIDEADDLKAAEAGIAALEAWFKKIGCPTNLAEANITDPDAVEKMAEDAYKTAVAWGEGDAYSVDIMRAQFELCK